MKLDKLAKKAKKELTRNAKKSAALGLCCVVAIWFWAPLIAKWTGFGSASAIPPAPAAAAVATTPGAPATAAPPAAKASTLGWNEIVALMQRDPRSATANVDLNRDPFARIQPPAAEGEEAKTAEVEQTRTDETEITPQTAGLVLTSTLVVSSGGVANIGGHAYSVGEIVTPEDTDDAVEVNGPESKKRPTIEFKLLEVHANRVVLERKEKSYELVMKETPLPKGNRTIIRNGSVETN